MAIPKYLTVVVLILTGTALVVVARGMGAGPEASAYPPGVATSPLGVAADCATVPLPPPGEEVNTVLDVEHRVLQYSFLNPSSGEDTTVTISYADPTCTAAPELRQLIAHVLSNEAKVRADTCATVREILASGVTQIRGRTIDRVAAARLLATEC